MQITLAVAQRFERAYRFQHIISVGAGFTVALPHMVETFGKSQAPRILHVAAIDEVAERPYATAGMVFNTDPQPGFPQEGWGPLARPAIMQQSGTRCGGRPESQGRAR